MGLRPGQWWGRRFDGNEGIYCSVQKTSKKQRTNGMCWTHKLNNVKRKGKNNRCKKQKNQEIDGEVDSVLGIWQWAEQEPHHPTIETRVDKRNASASFFFYFCPTSSYFDKMQIVSVFTKTRPSKSCFWMLMSSRDYITITSADESQNHKYDTRVWGV